jgi:hypothetical protein
MAELHHGLEAILNRRINLIRKLKDPVMDAAQVLASSEEELVDKCDENYKGYLVVSLKAGTGVYFIATGNFTRLGSQYIASNNHGSSDYDVA